MSQLVLFLLTMSSPSGEVITTYQSPADVSEYYLNQPYAFVYGPNGKLYVIDRFIMGIHVWKADGKYDFTFGKQGEGPGEFNFPYKISAYKDFISVMDGTWTLSLFDFDGKFLRSFNVGQAVRAYAFLSPDLVLISYQKINSPTDHKLIFELVDGNGKSVRIVKEYVIDMFLAPVEGSNATTVKAFAAECDVQPGENDTWWFGHGNEKTIHQINAKGELVGKKTFDLPTNKPTSEDKDLVYSLTFPGPNGARLGFKDIPTLKVNFDHNKAYFTQFMIRGNRVLFLLTPIGGLNGVGNGFHVGNYYICDMKTGKTIKRGGYSYPEDSFVLFLNGRSLGMIVNENDEYDIKEIDFIGKMLSDQEG